MRRAKIFVDGQHAGYLEEVEAKRIYVVRYLEDYQGESISMTMPVAQVVYEFDGFPPFFDGLLPEGFQLEALLKKRKIDADDLFSQLLVIGQDVVGNITVEEAQ